MLASRSIQTEHKDLVHDVAYDHYGRRLATCSSDQYVKIWDLNDDRIWICTSSWKTHSGSVWKVTWANPEFGQILATCSFDRTAAVWEELGPEGTGGERTQSQWVKKINLVDSRTPVTDIKFGPRHLGLQLATCSADGIVRIYEAPDIMNLSQWCLQHEISCKIMCSCIAWSPSRTQMPLIAIGSDEATQSTSAKILIYEYNENIRRWSRVDVVPISDPVYDLSFAPNIGRSYHFLAVATKNVHIVLLRPKSEHMSILHECPQKFEVRTVTQFEHHNAQVWRVSWNITGTMLASSGDDGTVRLWRSSTFDSWKCLALLKSDGTTEPSDFAKTLSGDATDLLGTLSTMHFYKLASRQWR